MSSHFLAFSKLSRRKTMNKSKETKLFPNAISIPSYRVYTHWQWRIKRLKGLCFWALKEFRSPVVIELGAPYSQEQGDYLAQILKATFPLRSIVILGPGSKWVTGRRKDLFWRLKIQKFYTTLSSKWKCLCQWSNSEVLNFFYKLNFLYTWFWKFICE